MKHRISILILPVLIIIIISGCSTDSVVTVKQETRDNEIAAALNKTFNESFPQLQITTNTDCNIDDSIKSPVSGNVKITGWVTVEEQAGRTNWSLDFGFADYKTSNSSLTYIIFKGVLTYAGYSNEYTSSFTMKSGNLSSKGKVESLDFDYTCTCELTVTFNKYTGKTNITGNVCGRIINFNF